MKENHLAFAVGGVIGLALSGMYTFVLFREIGTPNGFLGWAFLLFEIAVTVLWCGILAAFIRSFFD